MPVGSHTHTPFTGQTTSGGPWSSGYQLGFRVKFSVGIVMRSMIFRQNDNAGLNSVKGTVWLASNSSRVADTNTYSSSVTAGSDLELSFASPLALAANTDYMFTYFSGPSGGANSGGATPTRAANSTYDSSPSYAVATIIDGNAYYSSGDNYPTTYYSSQQPWIHWSFQPINAEPKITSFSPNSGVINPLDTLALSWTYSDPESVAQTSAQLEWRYNDSTTPTTWNNTPSWTTLTTISGTGSSYTVPANTWAFDKHVLVRLRVSDGVNWSGWVERDFDTSAWEVAVSGTTALTGTLPTGMKRGGWQQRVRVANSGSGAYGAATASQSFDSQGPTDKFVLKGGLWHAVPKPYWNCSTWVHPS